MQNIIVTHGLHLIFYSIGPPLRISTMHSLTNYDLIILHQAYVILMFLDKYYTSFRGWHLVPSVTIGN